MFVKKIQKKKILVVAAHPDDELLGLAGSLCRHRDMGDYISILLLSTGEDSRGQKISNQNERISQANKVAEKLNANLYIRTLPDNALDSVPLLKIIKIVEDVFFKVKPDTIYTHYSDDLNIDHRLTFQAVLTAARPIPGSSIKRIYSFETLSSTEWQTKMRKQFSPNYYIDISKYLLEKKKLLAIYKNELRLYPHPRSLKGVEVLAKYRGMGVGVTAAEAFQIIRAIE